MVDKKNNVMEFSRKMGKSAAGKKLKIDIFKNPSTQSSVYLCTPNSNNEFFEYVTAKNRAILIRDENFEYSRKNEDGPAFRLNNYTFLLGKNVLNLIGEEYKSINNEFVASKNSEDRLVMYKIVYKNLYAEGKEGYKWFVDLFDKMVGYMELLFKIDEVKREFIFDIEWPRISDFISPEDLTPKYSKDIQFSHNRIISGAPGTGKSYKLNKDKKIFNDRFERVTFHPNYSYSQFVGTYKPVSKHNSQNGTEDITYKFVPGPFIRSYIKAYESKDPYLLLIEEINRSNVTAVFGDIFQLLDRKNGESEFEIETSEDLRNFFCEQIDEGILDKNFDFEKMKIPDNLYIWATMNSADQGVFPMDTAFKRRWDFEYMGIDEGVTDEYKKIKIKLPGSENPIYWNKLRKAINEKLSGENVNEDKLLGPYFISNEILKYNRNNIVDEKKFNKAFENKVLMYLFEDAGKHCPNLFENCSDKSKFSSILNDFKVKGIKIFGFDSSEFEEED